MPSLEQFRPKLRSSELSFHNDQILLKSDVRYVFLPIHALHFLIYFNGKRTLPEIVAKSHGAQKTFHFGMLMKSLSRLKDKGFLENSAELDNTSLSPRTGWFSWLDNFLEVSKPFRQFSIRPIVCSRAYHLCFYLFSVAILLFSLFAASQFPLLEIFNGFLVAGGSYWQSGLSLLFCLSLFLSLKYIMQLGLQLLLLGNAYNVRLLFNGLCLYVHVSFEAVLSYSNRLGVGLYFLCSIPCYFLFTYLLSFFGIEHWLLMQVYLVAFILFIYNLNPFGYGDISQLFKRFSNDDHFNQVSWLLESYSKFMDYESNDKWSFHHLRKSHSLYAILWTIIAVGGIIYYTYEIAPSLLSSLHWESTADRATILIFFAISLFVLTVLLKQLVKSSYAHFLAPLNEIWMKLKRVIYTEDVTNYDRRKLFQELRNLPLFGTLGHSMVEHIVGQGKVVKYKPGHRIIIQGDVGVELFVLLDGVLQVRNKFFNLISTLGDIKPVSIFGEIALIEKTRRTAEVLAKKDSLVFKVDANFLKNLMASHPEVEEIDFFKNAIIMDQFFHSSPMFKRLSKSSISLLKEKGKVAWYKANEIIFEQQHLGDRFYLIIRGSVSIYANDQAVSKIKQGGFFGEISLIANIPRIVSVKALDNVMLLSIDRETFWAMLSENLELAILIEFFGKMRFKESISYLNAEPLPSLL